MIDGPRQQGAAVSKSDLLGQARFAVVQLDRVIDTVGRRRAPSAKMAKVLNDLTKTRRQLENTLAIKIKPGSNQARKTALHIMKGATANLRVSADALAGTSLTFGKVGKFVNFGASALTAIRCFSLSGKICTNPESPHDQDYPYPKTCPQCGYAVLP